MSKFKEYVIVYRVEISAPEMDHIDSFDLLNAFNCTLKRKYDNIAMTNDVVEIVGPKEEK